MGNLFWLIDNGLRQRSGTIPVTFHQPWFLQEATCLDLGMSSYPGLFICQWSNFPLNVIFAGIHPVPFSADDIICGCDDQSPLHF